MVLGFGRRDPSERPQMPRWMAWLLFGFIIYLVVIGNVHKNTAPPVVTDPDIKTEKAQAYDYPAIRRALDLSNWQRGFNPTLAKGLSIRDFTVGKGRPVACGDEVTISLRGRDSKGKNFDESFDETKPLTFVVGEGKTYKAVEQSVIGMQMGGERNADAPPVLVYGEEKSAKELSSLELRMTLNKIAPEIDAKSAPLLVSMSQANSKGGAQCGETIPVEMHVWDMDDKKPTKLAMDKLTLGTRQLAIGLDYVLPGIAPGETRTVMLPTDYQLHNGNDSPFTGKHIIVVEVTRK